MIPSNSYPEAPAKVRVINLQDQLKHTVKTLQQACTLHHIFTEEPEIADLTALKKEPLTICNLPDRISTALRYILSAKPADIINDRKFVHILHSREQKI